MSDKDWQYEYNKLKDKHKEQCKLSARLTREIEDLQSDIKDMGIEVRRLQMDNAALRKYKDLGDAIISLVNGE